GLQRMGAATLKAEAHRQGSSISVTLQNPAGGPVAFFTRLSLLDPNTHKRLLPTFYSDNYVSIPPGESRTVTIEMGSAPHPAAPLLSVEGWNVPAKTYPVN